jgi:hypothetical protein
VRRRDLAPQWTQLDSVDGSSRPAPRRRADVHGVELDDESVLYDERNDRLHFLNWSASAVWWSIDGRASVDDLAAELADRFHAEPDVMRTDVATLLERLGSEELVEAVRTPGGSRA